MLFRSVTAGLTGTDEKESITWSQNGGTGFKWLPNDPQAWDNATTDAERKEAAVGNACVNTPESDFASVAAPTEPFCLGSPVTDENVSGTPMLAVAPESADAPFSVTQTMVGGSVGAEAVAFGVIVAGGETKVTVEDRVLPGAQSTEGAAFSAEVGAVGGALVSKSTGSTEKIGRASCRERV